MSRDPAPQSRFGIAEWYGQPLLQLSPARRQQQARIALQGATTTLPCPFKPGSSACHKPGGVCSLQRYALAQDGQLGRPKGDPVIICPTRFEEESLLVRWLAEIVGFDANAVRVAREVPFMQDAHTGKPAGKIDLVVAQILRNALRWFGLEIQAVYFSGPGMKSQFAVLRDHQAGRLPFPDDVRRPDWRSSSAKRLMPQLQIKVPTLRRWGSKLAVAVDRPFFAALGGPSATPSQDLDDGDVIWLVPKLVRSARKRYRLARGHWEVLTLEQSIDKLRAAHAMPREAFENALRAKLGPVPDESLRGVQNTLWQ